MAIIKCKMCGGDLHFEESASICECEYCGNTNTLPVVSSDQEMNLFKAKPLLFIVYIKRKS